MESMSSIIMDPLEFDIEENTITPVSLFSSLEFDIQEDTITPVSLFSPLEFDIEEQSLTPASLFSSLSFDIQENTITPVSLFSSLSFDIQEQSISANFNIEFETDNENKSWTLLSPLEFDIEEHSITPVSLFSSLEFGIEEHSITPVSLFSPLEFNIEEQSINANFNIEFKTGNSKSWDVLSPLEFDIEEHSITPVSLFSSLEFGIETKPVSVPVLNELNFELKENFKTWDVLSPLSFDIEAKPVSIDILNSVDFEIETIPFEKSIMGITFYVLGTKKKNLLISYMIAPPENKILELDGNEEYNMIDVNEINENYTKIEQMKIKDKTSVILQDGTELECMYPVSPNYYSSNISSLDKIVNSLDIENSKEYDLMRKKIINVEKYRMNDELLDKKSTPIN